MFTGSVSLADKSLLNKKEKFEKIIEEALARKNEIIIRDCKQDNELRIPVDLWIVETLLKLKDKNVLWNNQTITIIKQPGKETFQSYTFPHETYLGSTSIRTPFYREMLDLTDIIVGVGGELGLMRISILAEFTGTAILPLPGTGDVSDILWNEFFQKSHQLSKCSQSFISKLKRLPYINDHHTNSEYANSVLDVINLMPNEIKSSYSERNTIITTENITLLNFFSLTKNFSLSMWMFVITLLGGLISIGIFLAKWIP